MPMPTCSIPWRSVTPPWCRRTMRGELATRTRRHRPLQFVSWKRGDSVTLKRFDGYWGGPIHLDTVVFRFISDPNRGAGGHAGGRCAAFHRFPGAGIHALLQKDQRFHVIIGPTEGEVILAMNNRVKPLNDLRVRQALAMAIDRHAIIQGAMYGYGQAIGSHFPPQNVSYEDLTGLNAYNPARAKQLLAEAGYPAGFDITLDLPPPVYCAARRRDHCRPVGRRRRSRPYPRCRMGAMARQGLRAPRFRPHRHRSCRAARLRHLWPARLLFRLRQSRCARHLAGVVANRRSAPARCPAQAGSAPDRRSLAQRLPVPVSAPFRCRCACEDIWLNAPTVTLDWRNGYIAGAVSAEETRTTRWPGWIFPSLLAAIVATVLVLAARTLGFRYLLGKIGVLLVTLAGASLVVFAVVQVLPGDPASYMMGLNASPQALAALRNDLGLNAPFPVRYLHWVIGLLHGDFGISYVYRAPVGELILERLALSLPLAALAVALSLLIGLLAGILSALRPR
ncbi:MAG: ABC transporter substrate-binding protein [Asticcacaulis sp.]